MGNDRQAGTNAAADSGLRLVRVAVPVPLADAFDYLAPAGEPLPPIGSRVRVPFGRRESVGLVIDHPRSTPLAPEKLKPLREALDRRPMIGAELMQTLRWAADYYHHPVGEVLAHALPKHLREGRALDAPPERPWRLTPLGAEQSLERLARAKQQARALAALRSAPLTAAELAEWGVAADVLRRLAAKGWIEPVDGSEPRALAAESPAGGAGAAAALHAAKPAAALPALTDDQRDAIAAVEADRAAGFRAYLLHGVTGSGKTEVYLRLIAAELAADRQTLLLVPEIGLTPQLVGRLRDRFGAELAILHSGLTERERFDAWRRAHRREAKVMVGTRSAVFAPLPAAGLIIVDEEHDASYKQQTGFRYSARDLAVVRAQRLDVPIVLASATPSLESVYNAQLKRYRKLEMPRRIGSAGEPELRVIDMNVHASRQTLSTPLVAAIGRHLAAGNQVLLFLNRRGFAPALFCTSCQKVEQCARCDARLTVHAKANELRCHHCGASRPLRWECPQCGGARIAVGAGTQRVGDELAALFPRARVARVDRDTTSRKGALSAVLGDVERGDVEILIGTQMLTKGHDFPRVTLVGVLNADQGLFGTDPRSHERLAQTVLQVAGRAGRAERPGEVLIQTHYPAHPLLRCLLSQSYSAFAELALAERRDAGWPPYSHLAAFHAEAAQREPAFAFLSRVRDAIRGAQPHAAEVTILGPAPQAMERKDGRYRAQLLLQCARRAPLHGAVSLALGEIRKSAEARKVRWSLDVDPLEL
ncbi:MAG TPA: primosomal protein N' [Gammaproteobacteria bacterium]|nr:primosomal protein N' [Gammaproteobacteria bacterium]